MIITVTRKYSKDNRVNTNKYNMVDWDDALHWVEDISNNPESYPFKIMSIKNDYGQNETYKT